MDLSRFPDEVGIFRLVIASCTGRVAIVCTATHVALCRHLEPDPLVYAGRHFRARYDRVRIRALVIKKVDDDRLFELDGLFVIAVRMFQLDAIKADADFRCILDWRVADTQIEDARITGRWWRLCGRRRL